MSQFHRLPLVAAALAMALSTPAGFANAQYYQQQQQPDACRNAQIKGGVAGGAVGALVGSQVASRKNRTEGALLGALAGALVGSQVAKGMTACARQTAIRAAAISARTGQQQFATAPDTQQRIVTRPAGPVEMDRSQRRCQNIAVTIDGSDSDTLRMCEPQSGGDWVAAS